MEPGSKSPADQAGRGSAESDLETLASDPPEDGDSPAGAQASVADGRMIVRLSGAWQLAASRPASEAIARELHSKGIRSMGFESAELGGWDSSLLAFLREVERACRSAGIEIERDGLPAGARRLLELAEAVPERKAEVGSPPAGHLERIGQWAYRFAAEWLGFLEFLGQVVLAAGRVIALRSRFRRSDFLLHLQQAGADALPIITLISLLVGLILAFVGAIQLQQFGADIFVADLVGIGMLREMSSMMAGIIMAGRTGAAYAAQLGSMKVAEEIDALVTFGIAPIDFLVLPRILALTLMMPLLCLYANVLGILGGAAVGTGVLGLSTELYWQETLKALTLTDLMIGVTKACVYGLLVAVSGCLRGLQARGGAAAVGAAATSAVVTSIVAIVVADGLSAIVCNALGV
jgi:phospholipid/cholesterol/gamma-HCH transport system permease protein